ncbi:DNA-3-methyladenine glycosylase [Rathayibacter soli]|uniref:DNA-3-methyladenine glycosylase n=1 Tax=Rathayibacter soli TaxID=3144168 RepID=UPI0027E541A3|nr:DNA-3-methyladenine glycosylase [Glaciibacter superstes]
MTTAPTRAGVFDRDFFQNDAVTVAPQLLGALLSHESEDGVVTVRITEVEAYLGDGTDPGSHAFRGKTARNAVMFGEPGHFYAYFSYGMHVCGNVVCSPNGHASGVLLRGAEVVDGIELARARRGPKVRDRDLARGPARLVVSTGIALTDNGVDLLTPPFQLRMPPAPVSISTGPRTGVGGPGGGSAYPWRFWITGDPFVSPYKRSPRASE